MTVHNKAISIRQVAQQAGVSYQTVSRVINNSPNVSQRTSAHVQHVIDQMGYRPSNSARALATRQSRTIGFIVGGVSYYGPISTMGAIEEMARAHGLYVSVSIVDERECTPRDYQQLSSNMLGLGVDGLIVLAPTQQMFESVLSTPAQVPTVVLTSSDYGHDVSALEQPNLWRFVGIDQNEACQSLLTYLLGLGHRSFWFFAGPQQWGDARARRQAWEERMEQEKLQHPDISYTVSELESWDAQEAYRAALSQFASLPREVMPSAIVAANDLQAFAILKALYALGINVPHDVSVVGFDDMPGSDVAIPALTSVNPGFAQLGTQAMMAMMEMLGDEGAASAASASGNSESVSGSAESASGRENSSESAESDPVAETAGLAVESGVPQLQLLPAHMVVRDSCSAVSQR